MDEPGLQRIIAWIMGYVVWASAIGIALEMMGWQIYAGTLLAILGGWPALTAPFLCARWVLEHCSVAGKLHREIRRQKKLNELAELREELVRLQKRHDTLMDNW